MKSPLTLLAALLAAFSAHAAEPAAQVDALFRVLKADGATVLGQVLVTPGLGSTSGLTIKQSDAIAAADGRCAFNVKYDEVASAALKDSTNRLYGNDTLIAQNTHIDLQARTLRTVWTQAYLFAGVNNVKVVLNADSPKPTVGWLRIVVDGSCGAPAKATAPSPVASQPAPAPTPAPVKFSVPGSGDWNKLYTAFGYSNYATTQLKGKGYARYADLVKLNADLSAVVAAQRVEPTAFAALMARWNGFANDAAFKAAMAAIVSTPGKK